MCCGVCTSCGRARRGHLEPADPGRWPVWAAGRPAVSARGLCWLVVSGAGEYIRFQISVNDTVLFVLSFVCSERRFDLSFCLLLRQSVIPCFLMHVMLLQNKLN